MKTSGIGIVLVAMTALALAGCGDDGDSQSRFEALIWRACPNEIT